MALMDLIGGVVESVGLKDIVGNLFGNTLSNFLGSNFGGFATEILSGAVTNAAVAGLAGGDIGKAALFGAAGGVVSGAGMGKMGDTVGGAVRGYGLAESMDGNGLLGALGGGAGAFMNSRSSSRSASTSPGSASGGNVNQRNVAQNGSVTQPTSGVNSATPTPATASSSPIQDKLKSLGLVDQSGEGTLLGKALVMGIGGMAGQKNSEDLLETQLDNQKEVDRYRAEIDHEAEQKRIAAFTSNPKFKVIRNG